MKSQKADSCLSELWDEVLPVETLLHFIQADLQMRKWEVSFQVVVLSNLRIVVLQIVHVSCGHLGVKKTYDHVCAISFGLC